MENYDKVMYFHLGISREHFFKDPIYLFSGEGKQDQEEVQREWETENLKQTSDCLRSPMQV